jgi:hypothetical protein
VPNTFLAVLVRDGTTDLDAELPWEHPLAETAPPAIRRHLHHAGLFSLVAWGAALVYNRGLSRLLAADGGEGLDDVCAADLDNWRTQMDAGEADLARWDRTEFWYVVRAQNPHVSTPVRAFVDWWLDRATRDPASIPNDARVIDRLREREAILKGPRAKLANRRAREQAPTAQGDDRLTFRWPQARRIVADINRGLAESA